MIQAAVLKGQQGRILQAEQSQTSHENVGQRETGGASRVGQGQGVSADAADKRVEMQMRTLQAR